uniref:Guanine nucleotide exchange factor MSS4 n=1 Tax=Glossina brevipalpis TaxID=37001 RepID=A0A1A9WKS8_9MUSC
MSVFYKNMHLFSYEKEKLLFTDIKMCENEILNNKNKQNIRCRYCNSLILRNQQGEYTKLQVDLPLMHQKNTRDVNTVETEKLIDFWLVNDMFIFENVGFSNTVDKRKYLTCADCDIGPLGYFDINTKKCYLALQRVHYGNELVKDVNVLT